MRFPNSANMPQAAAQQRTAPFQQEGVSLNDLNAGTDGGEGGIGANQLLQGASFLANLLSKGNPYLQLASLALPLIGRFLGGTEANPRHELEREIIQARKERLADLRRQAKGKFTPAERQDIRRANEQILNRVASNIAQRGLEASGVAGQILAEAEQAPFLQAQKQAQAKLDDFEVKTFNLTQKMVKEDDGFVKDLQKVIKYFADAEKNKKKDVVLENLDTAITSFQKLLGELNQLRGGQL